MIELPYFRLQQNIFFLDFGPHSPKDTGVQTYTLTTLPRNPSFIEKNQENSLDQGDLNHSNISGWVLANMPRTLGAVNRRASSSRSDTDNKRKTPRLKGRGFKLPVNSTAKQPCPQHQIQSLKNQVKLLANYQSLQITNPTSPPGNQTSPKANNMPKSRILNKESPKPPRLMYTQVTGGQLEKLSTNNNISDVSPLPDDGSNGDNTLFIRGENRN